MKKAKRGRKCLGKARRGTTLPLQRNQKCQIRLQNQNDPKVSHDRKEVVQSGQKGEAKKLTESTDPDPQVERTEIKKPKEERKKKPKLPKKVQQKPEPEEEALPEGEDTGCVNHQ